MKKIICTALTLSLLLVFFGVSASAASENLAAGKSYTIESGAYNDRSYSEMQNCNGTVLTDGQYGTPQFGTPAWGKFYRATDRTVKFDLGEVCTIERVYTRFLHNSSAGIVCPKEIKVYVSQNGSDYAAADIKSGNKSPFLPGDSFAQEKIAEYDIIIEKVCARYVAVYFDIQVNSFCDEIEIHGTKGSNLPPLTNFVTIGSEPRNAFCARESLGGDHDIICFHAGYSPDNEPLVNNTVSSFIPYVGYADKSGKVSDTMFDSVMFLTLQGKCPSGGNLTINGGETVMTDWIALLDNYFDEQYNLHALDEATRQIKETLSLDAGHTTSVYLTMPFPKVGNIDFGDYTGDGVSDKIAKYEDCLSVLDWFMDEVDARWDAAGFENIRLKGYFFFSEGLTRQYYDYEYDLAYDTVELIHKRNLYSVMIPYYQAVGIDDVYDIGFDAALMQPNLSFNETLQDDPDGVMEDFAATAKKYGLGMQMEIADGFRWEPEKLGKFYEAYLEGSSKSGLMTDTIHAYYNGAGPGVFFNCHNSNDPYSRWAYDATYKFIKGTLDLSDEYTATATTEVTTTGRERATGATGASGDWFYTYEATLNPANGFVVFGDNTFSYTADRKFSGTDKFSYKIIRNGVVIAENEVTVTVLPEEAESSEANVLTPDDSAAAADNESDTFSLIFAIVTTVVLLSLLVIAILIVKNKRNENNQ